MESYQGAFSCCNLKIICSYFTLWILCRSSSTFQFLICWHDNPCNSHTHKHSTFVNSAIRLCCSLGNNGFHINATMSDTGIHTSLSGKRRITFCHMKNVALRLSGLRPRKHSIHQPKQQHHISTCNYFNTQEYF